MSLSHEHFGPKILAKIKIYVLIRAESLFPLCYEIPCSCLDITGPLINHLIIDGMFSLYNYIKELLINLSK